MKIVQGENALACKICGRKILLHSDIRPFITLFSADKKNTRIPLQKYEIVSPNQLLFSNGNISAELIAIDDNTFAITVPEKYSACLMLNIDKNNDVTQKGISLKKRYIVNKNDKPLKEKSSNRIGNFVRDFLSLNTKKERFTIDTSFDIGDYSVKLSTPPKSVDCTFISTLSLLFAPNQTVEIKIVNTLSN